jgi:hypothetical protein
VRGSESVDVDEEWMGWEEVLVVVWEVVVESVLLVLEGVGVV